MICQNEITNLQPNELENKIENVPDDSMKETKNDYKKNLSNDITIKKKINIKSIKDYCKCGRLKYKQSKICRKCFIPFENLLIGQKLGKLTLIEGPIINKKRTSWMCICDCGNKVTVNAHRLKYGKTKSCGCIRKEVTRKRNFENYKPYEYLYTNLKNRGKYKVDLTLEEFLEFIKITKCHYCNAEIKWYERHSKYYESSYAYNLDRKDNTTGYTKENCVVCCKLCNFTKANRFTYDEMLILGKSIEKINELREKVFVDV